jgi:hypothetical protein
MIGRPRSQNAISISPVAPLPTRRDRPSRMWSRLLPSFPIAQERPK